MVFVKPFYVNAEKNRPCLKVVANIEKLTFLASYAQLCACSPP
jgi:hypothetical protein